MPNPVSVRLEADVQELLEATAKQRGIGLSTYLRDLAGEEARRVRKERIRAQSRAVADYIASNEEARRFNDDWAGPAPAGTGG